MEAEGQPQPRQLSVEQRLAAFTALFGPHVASATYSSCGAFYVHNLGSPALYAAMLLCFYVPFSLVVFTQEHADAYFDRKFSTRDTYFVRVTLMHLVITVLAMFWMLVPQSVGGVLVFGACVGTVAGASISSAKQLFAAMDPRLTTYATMGAQVANVQPMFVFFLLDFQPSSSMLKFRLAVTYVVIICMSTAAILNFMHFRTDVFTKAYQRLAYDVDPDGEVFEPPDSTRQVTETQPLLPDHAKDGVPLWVWTWCTMTGALTVIKMCMASLSACFGDTELAQTLILMQFAVEFLGLLAALEIPHMPYFEEGPWHQVLAATSLTIAGAAALQFSKLGGSSVAKPLFLFSWAASNSLWSFVCCLIEVTTSAYVRVVDRKLVMRRNFFAKCTGTIVGLLCGLLLASTLET